VLAGFRIRDAACVQVEPGGPANCGKQQEGKLDAVSAIILKDK
jgi:hypothetical protein